MKRYFHDIVLYYEKKILLLQILLSNNYSLAGNSFCCPIQSNKKRGSQEPDKMLDEVLASIEQLTQIAKEHEEFEQQCEASNPLYKPIRDLHLERLKSLIENGAAINAPIANYESILNILDIKIYHSENDDLKNVIKLLLINGAKLNDQYNAREKKSRHVKQILALLNLISKKLLKNIKKKFSNIILHYMIQLHASHKS